MRPALTKQVIICLIVEGSWSFLAQLARGSVEAVSQKFFIVPNAKPQMCIRVLHYRVWADNLEAPCQFLLLIVTSIMNVDTVIPQDPTRPMIRVWRPEISDLRSTLVVSRHLNSIPSTERADAGRNIA